MVQGLKRAVFTTNTGHEEFYKNPGRVANHFAGARPVASWPHLPLNCSGMTDFKRLIPALLILLTSSVARADGPLPQLPQVTYATNDDTFHQEQYRDLLVKTQLTIKSALRTVIGSEIFSKSLGLNSDFQFKYPIRVEIKEIPEESLYHGLQGTAGLKKVEGQWVHVLTLNIGAYVQNPEEDVNQLLAHEMAHMVLADFMGEQKIEKVPMWLNEGMAQSVTHEGRSRVADFARSLEWEESMLIPCELDSPVDTFAHGEGNYACYPEYYLAVQRLRQVGGPLAVGKILRGLRDGQKTADAFLSATGIDYSLFQQDVNTFTADVIAERKPIP